jgi:hypothetical protein
LSITDENSTDSRQLKERQIYKNFMFADNKVIILDNEDTLQRALNKINKNNKIKKAVPQHLLRCRERYSSYSFMTSALAECEWSVSRPGCTLPPGKGPLVTTGQAARWAPEPAWTQRLEEKSFASARDQTLIA